MSLIRLGLVVLLEKKLCLPVHPVTELITCMLVLISSTKAIGSIPTIFPSGYIEM